MQKMQEENKGMDVEAEIEKAFRQYCRSNPKPEEARRLHTIYTKRYIHAVMEGTGESPWLYAQKKALERYLERKGEPVHESKDEQGE